VDQVHALRKWAVLISSNCWKNYSV